MASDISTIQSLKAVDAWIDVINANINGGVRTAFKASRLKFAGSNPSVDRAGTMTSLPLQFPEPSLVTQNTVIDFSQGAITASTENVHLAIQGSGFFLVCDPATMITTGGGGGSTAANANARFYLTRDGEFHTDQNGLLVNAQGYFLCTVATVAGPGGRNALQYDTAGIYNGNGSDIRAVYNDLDLALPPVGELRFSVRLSEFLRQDITQDLHNIGSLNATNVRSIMDVNLGMQSLQYSQFGSTVFDFGFQATADATTGTLNVNPQIGLLEADGSTATVLSKSLEASNASMTQSVPELSLAQKLFSALTKVLQTRQTNVDGVLNLVR